MLIQNAALLMRLKIKDYVMKLIEQYSHVHTMHVRLSLFFFNINIVSSEEYCVFMISIKIWLKSRHIYKLYVPPFFTVQLPVS